MSDTEKTESTLHSAKIYQFPPRGRIARRERETPRYFAAASGDSWYHDAAIADERDDKR